MSPVPAMEQSSREWKKPLGGEAPEQCRFQIRASPPPNCGRLRPILGLQWLILVIVGLWLAPQPGGAAPAPPAAPFTPGARTNVSAALLRARAARTNALANRPRPGSPPGVAPQSGGTTAGIAPQPGPQPSLAQPGARPGTVPPSAAKTNLIAASTGAGTNATAAAGPTNFIENLFRPEHRQMLIAIGGVALLCAAGIGLWLVKHSKKSKGAQVSGAEPPPLPSRASAKARTARARAIHSCNVLQLGAPGRKVWHFDAHGGNYVLSREQACPGGEPLPARLVAKDWRALFQRKLNIAWLPPEQVFLRVAQFPRSEFNETLAMVELQLEKLSPMPTTQIVWSLHLLPQAEGDLQTVIVLIVARSAVEEFLGKLEGEGYLADRLELPLLDQLETTTIAGDGAWIYPEASGGQNTALVAWWYGGGLQSLGLLTLPAANRPASLKEQLLQMAWAGELEGWLTGPPEWRLVADAAAAAEWEPALRAGLEQPVEVIAPLPAVKLAALTARRSARADPRASLMPPEFASRYQQQFWDRLWMKAVFGVFALYAVGVGIYLVTLGIADYRTGAVETQVVGLGQEYTNTIALRDRLGVLKKRQELKYAALDCWLTTAKNLPDGATLDNLNFTGGKRLDLSGTAPSDAIPRLNDFEKQMRRAPDNVGQPLFDAFKGNSLTFRSVPPNATTWNLGLELKRTEEP